MGLKVNVVNVCITVSAVDKIRPKWDWKAFV